MAKKRRQRRGHYCWSCQRVLPNERFSGSGYRQHLCKACSKLGKEELEYRQAVRNIERCLGWDGRVRPRQRKSFERFREHPNERVRKYVEKLEELWAKEQRREWFELLRRDEEAFEAYCEEFVDGEPPIPELRSYDGFEDDEIPF